MSASVGKKGKTIVLNLTSMIDICAILIIFLVMGTVIGQEDVLTPDGLKFPRSFNKDILETAPQVAIFKGEIEIKFLNRKMSLADFLNDQGDIGKRVRTEIKKYVEDMPQRVKTSGVLLNYIADSQTPYSTVFDTTKVFRENGFESILFVAEGN